MAKLKVYRLTTFSHRVPGPGNGSSQCEGVIAATSKKAAAEAFDMSVYMFNQFAGVTSNPLLVEVAMSESGVAFVAPLDLPVKTADDWVRVPPGQHP